MQPPPHPQLESACAAGAVKPTREAPRTVATAVRANLRARFMRFLLGLGPTERPVTTLSGSAIVIARQSPCRFVHCIDVMDVQSETCPS